MVTRPTSFCDIMLATQGKSVIADKKVDVVIPAVAMPTGKTFRKTYDVSPEGERVLRAIMDRMNKALVNASKELRGVGERVTASTENLGPMTAQSPKKSTQSEE